MILVFIIIVIRAILPRFDFMYTSADKHWQKEKIGDRDEKTGGKGVGYVAQGENGVYFIYKNRLMYIDDKYENIKEVCKDTGMIQGGLVEGDTIFLYKDDDIGWINKVDSSGKIVRFIFDSGKTYIEGENIYTLNSKYGLRKYDFNGNRISSNKVKFDVASINTVFDNYIFYRGYDGDDDVEVSIPNYYLFDANKINYKTRKLKLSRYYMQPEAGDMYWKEDVIPYDSVAKEVDKTVREGKIFDDTAEKNLDDYELQSVELLPWSFSEVQDEYFDSSKEDRNIYVYSMDVDTGLYKEIYRKKRFFKGNYSGEMFVTDKYIFIYEGSEYGVKECITRINRDGNSPVLVMDENGEVVMKPLESKSEE